MTAQIMASDAAIEQDAVPMNAISKTAFCCCGFRVMDARTSGSICADIYAEDFMTAEGWSVFSAFNDSPKQNVSNVVRSRIFQDEIARLLKQDPSLQVINIGAGFDSRAFRMGGGIWIEIDEPAIIFHKEKFLPASRCPNPLRRIPVNFARGELKAALGRCDTKARSLIVIEGVLTYLDRADVELLLSELCAVFPNHLLACDLMDRVFFDRHMGRAYQKIVALGSEFKWLEDRPEQLFLNGGYKSLQAPVSVVGRARDFKALRIPEWLFSTFLRTLRDGYRIHLFQATGAE